MNHRRFLPLFCIVLIVGFLSGCGTSGEEVRVLKLGHGLSQEHSVHQGIVYMGERLSKLSGGKMRLDIYPGAQLGSETQSIELLQIGSLAMTKVSTASLEGFVEEFKVFSIPYLFRSKEHLYAVENGDIGKELLEKTEKYLFRGLGFYDAGARSFYTMNKPIQKPEDLKGLKIRVMKSPTSVDMMKQFNSSATPISWPELYTALQSGVVDGAENNIPSFTTSHHHEVARHLSLNEHTMIPDLLIISKVIWDKLSQQEKEWLTQAVNESVAYQRKLWEEQEKSSLEEAKAAGVNIYTPDKQPFINMALPMHEQYKNNPRVNDLIQRIKAM